MGTDFRDVDNDGWPDIIVTALSGETFPLFKNDAGKFFHDATYPSGLGGASVRMAGWGAALADLDNDGFKDLVTANSHANDRIEEFEASRYRQANSVFRNQNGHFTDVSAHAGADFQVPRANRGIGIGDFDGDGRLDLVITVLGSGPQLLRNVSDQGHWITLRLVGQKEQPRRHSRPRAGGIPARSDDDRRRLRLFEQLRRPLRGGRRDNNPAHRDCVAQRSEAKLENVPADQILTVTEPKDR